MVTENQKARRLSHLLAHAVSHLLRDHNASSAIQRINDDHDVQPLSVFRRNVSALTGELQACRGETVSREEATRYLSARLDADEPEAGENG